VPAQLRLAYLYEGHGDASQAERLWAQIDPREESRASLVP
jgi:hypothetical protein